MIRDDVDPTEEYGARPVEIVPIFGWGVIPDQYGRVTPDAEDDDREGDSGEGE